MISDDLKADIVLGHTLWSNDAAECDWLGHRNAWKGEYWGKRSQGKVTWEVRDGVVTGLQSDANRDSDIYPVQVNLIEPFVNGFIASLYYNGIRVVVEPDELPGSGEKEEQARRTGAIKNLLNRFLGSSTIDDVSERLFTMGLMYKGGCAYKLRALHKDERIEGMQPTDVISVEAVPPWECVWDRKLRSLEDERWRGHLRQVPEHIMRKRFTLPADLEPEQIRDVVRDGFYQVTHSKHEPIILDESYFWLLTFDDYTHNFSDENGESVGTRYEYLVLDIETTPRLEKLWEGHIPLARESGEPLHELVPFIPSPALERALDSTAAVKNVYELNSELNSAQSIVSGSFRRDAGRVALTEDLDDETLAKINKARDLETVRVPAGKNPLDKKIQIVDWGQISNTLREYVDMVREGVDRTQITADFTRGKAGEYLSATEVANLVEYTAATIGRWRKRSDLAIAEMCEIYLVMLATMMEEMGVSTIEVDVEGETYKVTQDDLRLRWKIGVVDTAATPGASQQKLADFQAAVAPLMEMAGTIDPPTVEGQPSNMQRNLAMRSFEYMSELLNLPADFDPRALLSAVPPETLTPEPQLPETPDPSSNIGPQAGQPTLTPEGAAAAEAIMSQAEEEQF